MITTRRLAALPLLLLLGCDSGAGASDALPTAAPWRVDCTDRIVDPPAPGFCLNFAHPGLLLVGDVMSEDAGRTWWQPAVFPGDANLLTPAGGAVCSGRANGPDGVPYVDAGGDRLYAYYDDVLLRSDDGGETWRRLPLPVRTAVGVRSFLGARGASVLFQGDGRLFVSHDAGERFVERPKPPGVADFFTLALARGGVWLGDAGDHGVYASADQGGRWTALHPALVGRLHAGPEGDVWLVGDHTGLWHTDDGVDWSHRVPISGPLSWVDTPFAIKEFVPLPGARLAFTARVESAPTGRPVVLCVMGPEQSDSPGPQPLPEPPEMGEVGPGEIHHWRVNGQGVPQAGAIAVAVNGTPYVALGFTNTVSVGPETLFVAHTDDFVSTECGGEVAGLDHRIIDLDVDPLSGALHVLARPPTDHPQDWARLPDRCLDDRVKLRGPWLGQVNPRTGALLGADLVGPVLCARPALGVQPFAKCDDGRCDEFDPIFCPWDCGGEDTCGDGVCDDWEQLRCLFDCGAGDEQGTRWGGTCGNLECDQPVLEPGFCPGDCPPAPQGCVGDLEAIYVDPIALVPPSGVFTEWGLYDLPIGAFARPTVHPPRRDRTSKVITRGRQGGDVFLLRDGWIRRFEPPAGDPCHVRDVRESDHCYPAPDGHVSALGLSERSGHIYALLDAPGQLLRRPIDAAEAPWELVVEALVHPVDLAILDTREDTRVFILDGDVWLAIPPDPGRPGLPLRRSYR